MKKPLPLKQIRRYTWMFVLFMIGISIIVLKQYFQVIKAQTVENGSETPSYLLKYDDEDSSFILRASEDFQNALGHINETISGNCKRVVVVETEDGVSSLLDQFSNELPSWCFVLIDSSSSSSGITTLSNGNRKTFPSSSFLKKTSTKELIEKRLFHTFKRNFAYYTAIKLGADIIFDAHPNILLHNSVNFDRLITNLLRLKLPATVFNSTERFFNPFPFFLPTRTRTGTLEINIWPRGFPIQFVKNTSNQNKSPKLEPSLSHKISIFSSFLDKYPDVDSVISNVNDPLPIKFRRRDAITMLHHGQISPFASTCTLWTKRSFPLLLIPPTVKYRFSDTFRALIAQRLLIEIESHLGFISSFANRDNISLATSFGYESEKSIATLLQEDATFSKEMIGVTNSMFHRLKFSSGNSLKESVLAVFHHLRNQSYLSELDVSVARSWITNLCELGSVNCFPNFKSKTEEASEKKTVFQEAIHEQITDVGKTTKNVKVAVCVTGQVRSLNLPVSDPDHPKMFLSRRVPLPSPEVSVAENIRTVLYPKLGNPDVFMVVSTKETDKEPKLGDLSTCEPLRPKNGHLYCSVRKEVDEKIYNETSFWNEFQYVRNNSNDFRHVQGLIQQLKGLHECFQEVERYASQNEIEYDWVVRVRPDYYFIKFPELDELVTSEHWKNTLWYGTRHVCCCGNQDSFGIGSMHIMRPYFERFLHFQHRPIDLGNRWSAESYMEKYLELKGMYARDHPDIHVCQIFPRSRWGRSAP